MVKDDFPPKNPFYRNDPLHYYWFGHLPDAVEYRALGRVVDVDALLLGSSVMVDLAFVLVVYGLARLVVPVPWAAAAGAIWAFLFTSFEGVAWLRAETPPDAVVQADPVVRHTETWGYLPAFAEWRMAVGLPLGLVPLKKYEDGSRRIRRMYDVPDPAEAYEIAARSGVDYIVVGGPERQAHPGVEERLSHAGPLLPLVFHHDALSIYHVERHVQ